MRTRVFKSGNSMAVRLPKDLCLWDTPQDLEIERVGNTLVVRGLSDATLADVPDLLAAFPASFFEGGREHHDQSERDWGPLEPAGESPSAPAAPRKRRS